MNCATTNRKVCKRRNELRDYKQQVCKRRNELRDYKQQVCKRRNELRDYKQQVCKRRNELRDYKQRSAMNCARTNRLSIGIRISVSILDKMDLGKE